ncbi:MAG: ABC transporter substrate-binding protein [Peptococcaceae bacterium]|nr:ABC transporter substrate-binding protein [Peptococcaceae bacterium]
MKKEKKVLAILLSAALMVTSLAGCGGSQGTQSDAGTPGPSGEGEKILKKEIHIVPDNINTNLDIMLNTSDEANLVAHGAVFEQLVSMDASYNIVPELAEKVEVSDDNTEYIYYLRQGVKFHNGETMTADDVVASMNRWIDNAGTAKSMVGEGAYFEKVDDNTVKIKMDHSCAWLNQLIAGFGQRPTIMPKSIIDNANPDTGFVEEYVGTGPYKVDEIVEDQYIKIVKFNEYQPYGTKGEYSGYAGYKEAPIETIYFDFVSDSNTITAGMQTGQYQVTTAVPYDNYEMFANDENYNVELKELQMPMLIFNKKEGKSANPVFRRAVAAVINAEELMYAAYGNADFYELYSSYMFQDQTSWYTDAGGDRYNEKDPEKAKALFAEAGYDGSQPFRILVANDSEDFMAMATVIKSQLEAIDIPCELLVYDWSTFVSIRNNEPANYDAFITSFGPKVLPSMNLFLSSTWAGWVDDARILDDLVKINTSATVEEGVEIWKALQEYMWEENMPVVKFGNQKTFMVSPAGSEGLELFEHVVFVNAKVYE